jgi:UDP-N-acetylglucosamine 2-epimerase (non-hydrolysing)
MLAALLEALVAIAARLPLVWPMHPRTRASIERFGLTNMLRAPGLLCLPPQGYLEMVGLMNAAAVVLTDSGGVQEETTALGVPCLTLRENTERPITVEQGTNTLVGRDFAALRAAVEAILAGGGKRGRLPELWDGRTAGRIARHMAQWLRAPRAARLSA